MTRRMASFSGPAVAALVILAGARPSPAQQVVKLGEGETLTISGFINASLFTNHGLFGGFGQGQNAEWAAAAQPTTDKLFTDGDVRNTRINFTFNAAPVLGKWAPRATLEADFFGAFNGAPPFGTSKHSSASATRTSISRTAARRCGSVSSGLPCSTPISPSR